MNNLLGDIFSIFQLAFPPDWSTVIPDLIVALVTGVTVGATILIAERVSASRAESKRIERIGVRLVHPLLLVLQRPVYYPKFEDIGQLKKKQREALEILEDPDLDDWHEASPTQLTSALVKYRTALRDQRHDREDLVQVIRDWERIHGKEERIYEYASARIQEVNEHALRNLFPEKNERDSLEDEYTKMRKHGHVKSHARAYRRALARSERALGTAHEELVAQIRATSKTR